MLVDLHGTGAVERCGNDVLITASAPIVGRPKSKQGGTSAPFPQTAL